MHDLDLVRFFDRPDEALATDTGWSAAHEALLRALEDGRVRAAMRGADGTWRAVPWVKRAILLGFRRTEVVEIGAEPFSFFDKAGYPPREFTLAHRVRLVPGGSSIRRGAHVAPGVVVVIVTDCAVV